MVETPYIDSFIKGMDEAKRHGYSPGLNTAYQAPKSQKITFAQAQGRLRKEIGSDFVSDAGDRARVEFAAAVGQEVARQLQAAGLSRQEQTPLTAREGLATVARHVRQGTSWADASRKLKADLGEDFLNEGAALQAKSRTQAQTAVRRFGPNLASCKIKQL